jgi:hypothetical protein
MAPSCEAPIGALAVKRLTPALFLILISQKAESLDRISLTGADLFSQIETHELRMKEIKAHIGAKTKLYHSLSQASHGPSAMWIDEKALDDQRRGLAKMTKIALRLNLQELEALQTQVTDLKTELEWNKFHTEAPNRNIIGVNNISFRCQKMPINRGSKAPLQLVQDFGKRVDKETGIEWTSMGWWIAESSGEVSSCAPGIVMFSAKVPGRNAS